MTSGRAPESGRDLCSQPTMSRLENAPSRTEVARMTAALVDIFCRSFPAPPAAVTLDIDDTCDAVHGNQQLSLFNAHYDRRCFLPVHVYHVESGKPVAVLLRPGKTPSGPEVRTLLKHLVRRIRRHWPHTRLVFRGDAHYGRPQAMAWCEENGVDYIFGLAGNRALHALAYEVADDLKVRRAEAGAEKMRCFADFACAARSWGRERRRFRSHAEARMAVFECIEGWYNPRRHHQAWHSTVSAQRAEPARPRPPLASQCSNLSVRATWCVAHHAASVCRARARFSGAVGRCGLVSSATSAMEDVLAGP